MRYLYLLKFLIIIYKYVNVETKYMVNVSFNC